MTGLSIQGLRKRFGEVEVLKGIDLTAAPGEFLSLVGPSGCGKTTLMRIVAGLEQADEGEVVLEGRRLSHLRAADRDIAMVFQSYALYPHLDALANIAVPLLMRELSFLERLPLVHHLVPGARAKRADIQARARKTAETLGVSHLLDRKPGQMSGGQRQRVALGRAIIRRPRAFLMDEPLSNLDAALRVQMRQEIVELHRRVGATTVYVTHDQVEAMTMSDRVALMMEGELVQVGPPRELYDDPADTRVACFIGSPKINLLSLDATAGAGHLRRELLALLPETPERDLGTLGVRPEHLGLAGTTPEPEQLNLDCRFLRGEFLGAEMFGYFVTEAAEEPVTARLAPDALAGISAGQRVRLTAARQDLLLFRPGGQRLRVAAPASVRQEAVLPVRAYG